MEDNSSLVRYTYRLRIKSNMERLLMREHYKALWIWNECVARSKRGERFTDKELTQNRRWHDWLWEGSVVVGQQVIRKFNTSKGPHNYKSRKTELPSLNYTLRGFSIKEKNKLCLANGISGRLVISRELPSKPTSVTVYQDSLGDWYASFVVTRPRSESPEPIKGKDSMIGLDPGVSRIMTATDREYDLDHPQYTKRASKDLAKTQRKMARRKPKRGQKASRGYNQAKLQAAKVHKKIARQRQDNHRKWAHNVCIAYAQIALEDFKPKFLSQTTMAKKATDAGIGSAIRELAFMANKFERDLVMIDPKYTTMTCSDCDVRTKHRIPLSQRVFECDNCGLIMDRDENAARTILNRAGFNPAGNDEIRPNRMDESTLIDKAISKRRSEPGIPSVFVKEGFKTTTTEPFLSPQNIDYLAVER